MRLQKGEPQRLTGRFIKQLMHREKVAKRLRHLLAIHGEKAVMHPVLRWRCAIMGAGALCNLVLMVREYQIKSAAMNIKCGAKQIIRHGRAFKMPARTAIAPRAIPPFAAFGRGFPQYKIGGVLFVRRNFHARPCDQFVSRTARKLAILRHRLHGKQNMPFRLVRIPFLDQGLGQGNHLRDIGRGAGLMIGAQRVETIHIFVENLRRANGQFFDRNAAFLGTS